MYYSRISTILKAMASEQNTSSPSKLWEKRLAHLVHCKESRIVSKTGQQEKLYPPTDVSVSQQCCPQLPSVKFENLVHSIFISENSTLEINVSHFGVPHWQQWQPPAPASEDKDICRFSDLVYL